MWNSAENLSARSASFRSDDGGDEEALRWAALERLPTYNRVRKGIFRNIVGDLKEINVEKLLVEERKVVLDRLVSSVEDDCERFFDRMRRRFDGVELVFPKIEVRFQHLTVESFVYVGSRALPTIPNFIFNMTEALLRKLHIYPGGRRKLTILDDISGIIRPSRLTLLLGPPSSGKTTLLLALAGRLGTDLQMSGTVTYNGHSLKEFVPQKTSSYVSQQDWHVAEMTVRETLDFSAHCQGVGCKYDMLLELSRREKLAGIKPDEDLDILMKALALGGQDTSLVVEYILKILGLDICADTLVGDEMLKGISGGQKKRLTTGFDPNFTRCLRQFLVYFFLHQMSLALFRVMGSLGRSMIVANTFGSFAMLVVMGLGGYVISRDSISSGWIWGFWISPLMYAQNAVSVNEFLGHSWDKRAGNHTNLSLGKALLKARSLFPQSYWYWIGVGALLGYTVLFNILFTIFLTYLNPLGKRQAVVSEEEFQERDRRKKGGEPVVIQLRQFLEHSGSLKGKCFEQRGMVLPFQPLSMSFSNINYYVDVPLELKQQGVLEDRLQLLVNITGAFRPGVLTALVGLLFMKRGGEVIYAGPLGPKSYKLIEYFEAIEGVPKIRPGYNPAAWMLDVTSSAEENRLGVDFAEVYRRSNIFQRNKELVEILSKPNRESKDLNFPTKYSQSYIDQFLACLWKQNLSYWRNPQYTAVRFFYTVIISLMLGTICWRFGSKRDTQQEIFNAMGSMYAAVLFIGVTNGTAVQPVVSVERFVSYRERAAGMYSALPFAFAQVAIEFPYSIPIWWRWYYWANPVAWSLYGLLASQYGDSNKLVKLSDGVKSMPIRLLVKDVFGFRHDFVGVAAFMVVTFCMMFALIFAYGIKSFNFQKR
ncbi:pleiotropic drug resistance 4 [Actinidia rufa]|uniref:Pleiotropic drug resistance 4 n=1 Tax=Actinidia rufa TaxID=165716 RepID=A0A7J0DSX8_9ERIC|nr:pleiotropic drug resistance 4 [Actinidia rufa]